MKIIKDFDNYAIYENGDVCNLTTNKILKGSISENGYKYYRLTNKGTKKMVYAHILVATYYIENPNNLPIVNHIDGNKLNNNINNLEWVSYSTNTLEWHKQKTNKTKGQHLIKYTEDLDGEIWKQVKDFSNYLISNLGRVRNIKTNNLLRPSLTCGYYKIRCCQNKKTKDFMIHKLVYETFSEDYSNDKNMVIDHIDGNKLNNAYSNLRKITLSENVKSAYYNTKTNSSCKKVGQYDLNNNLIHTFQSARQAAEELGLDSSVISKVCRGVKYKTHGGFIFKYI